MYVLALIMTTLFAPLNLCDRPNRALLFALETSSEHISRDPGREHCSKMVDHFLHKANKAIYDRLDFWMQQDFIDHPSDLPCRYWCIKTMDTTRNFVILFEEWMIQREIAENLLSTCYKPMW